MLSQTFGVLFSIGVLILGSYLFINSIRNRGEIKKKNKNILPFILILSFSFIALGLSMFFFYSSDLILKENKLVVVGLVEDVYSVGTKSPTEAFKINGVEIFNNIKAPVQKGNQYRVEYYKNSNLSISIERVHYGEKELKERKIEQIETQ